MKDAQANLRELVNALGSKVDEIDAANDMAMTGGVYDDDQTAAAEARLMKKKKLLMLKDNVTVLSTSLDALATRCQRDSQQIGSSHQQTYVDVEAIEAIIKETAEMIKLLHADDLQSASSDRTTATINHDMELADDIATMDNVVNEMEEETLALDDMVANVEALNYYDDELMNELESTFHSLNIPSEILITPVNFDPQDIHKRPKNWNDVRMKRVLIKEYVDRLEGVSEEQIRENRHRNLELVSSSGL